MGHDLPMARRRDPEPAPERSVDLHGRRPEEALRRLAQELHAARVSGADRLRVITGRGWGNRTFEPILRKRVEAWLRGEEGRRLGVRSIEVAAKGGALDLRLS